MKSLIIGGAGFVGPYLIEHLVNDLGQSVSVTKMRHEELHIEETVRSKIKIFDLDILDKQQISNLINAEQPDYIYHLAAQSSVGISWRNPQLTIDVNIKGTVNLLEVLKELEYKPRVLLIGSGEEYGHVMSNENPIVEDNNTRPGNTYAATKACQNMLGKIYYEAYGLSVIMVRAFNHIGPNQLPQFVVADFCKQVAEIEAGKKEAVVKVGNLNAARDFTDVRDVVRAYALVAEKGSAGEIYNVGSGQAVTIQRILELILANSKVDIAVVTDENKLRPVDVPIIEANITKLKETTGWDREIELEETIKDTLDYWRNNV